MTDPRIEQIREALENIGPCDKDNLHVGLWCAAHHQKRCTAEQEQHDAEVALSSLEAELRTCSRDWQEIHDALDGKPAPGATRLLESAARIDNLRVSLAVAEAELETMRRRVDAGNKLEDIARESHKKYDDLATAVEALVEKWRRWSDELPESGLADLLVEHQQMGQSDAYQEAADELQAALSGSTPEDTDG